MIPLLPYFGSEMVAAQSISGGSGTYINGEWVASLGVAANITIVAPQPLAANEQQMLADGEHVRDFLVTWTTTRLYPREGSQDADRVLYGGNRYQVVQTDNRLPLGGFYRVVLRRMEPGTL